MITYSTHSPLFALGWQTVLFRLSKDLEVAGSEFHLQMFHRKAPSEMEPNNRFSVFSLSCVYIATVGVGIVTAHDHVPTRPVVVTCTVTTAVVVVSAELVAIVKGQ